jgi:hypothetical protein
MPRIKRTLTHDLPNGDRVVAHLELRLAPDGERFDEQGLSPGYSATISGWEARRNASGKTRQRQGRDIDFGGADHETLLKHFRGLAPIVALHLSDPDGTPMHAEANGWYWYSSFDGQGTHFVSDGRSDYDVACDLLRLPRGGIPCPQNRASFKRLVDAQRGRWAAEAAAARALLESLPTEGDGDR